jgi:hypothetical protein
MRNGIDQAVHKLHQAKQLYKLPYALLAQAELFRIIGDFCKVQRDLDEVMTIATRGNMRLHEADCHLEYSRLYLAMGEKEKARESLDAAKKMIKDMGYHRILLATAHLHILEGKNDDARQTLAAARTLIDEMGCHRWDIEVKILEKQLKV